jgi:ubiquinone/menaquinone biosynthesis C-methylase UbiE
VTDVQGIARIDEAREEVPCPLCGANAPLPDMTVRDRLFWRPGVYEIVRCAACSMRYVSPRPTLASLGAHYPDNYFIYKRPEDDPAWVRPLVRWMDDRHWKRGLRRIERVIGPLTPSTQVVDVGCGMNHLLAMAKQLRGCEGIGVDFKAEVAAYVRDVRKMPCIQGTLHDGHFADAAFDLVTMNEYLEHEPNPRAVLHEARRITKPGGHISIEVPFSDGLPARIFGSRWTQIDAPRHLVHFTKETLKDILVRSGYEVVHVSTFQIPLMIGFSAVQWLGAKHVGGPGLFDSGLALLASLPFYLAYPWMDEFMHVVARAA